MGGHELIADRKENNNLQLAFLEVSTTQNHAKKHMKHDGLLFEEHIWA